MEVLSQVDGYPFNLSIVNFTENHEVLAFLVLGVKTYQH